MTQTHNIYMLLNENDQCFYIGRSNDPERRLQEHIDQAPTGTSRKCQYIRDMLSRGHKPTIRVVDEAPADKIAQVEAYWIDAVDCTDALGYVAFLQNGNKGSQGNPIDEVALRDDIKQWKRAKKKRKPVPRATTRPPTADQLADAERLFREDPFRFRLQLEARREMNS